MVSDRERGAELIKLFNEAMSRNDADRAAELYSEMITIAERTGEIDHAKAVKMRLDMATHMIRHAERDPREKVTLSLRRDVLRALRLASAESNKDMSEIVTEGFMKVLKDYPHASSALLKKK
jgi:hypothetical protein